jgi:AraC-like DNA-binding protein
VIADPTVTQTYRELPPPTSLNAHVSCFWVQHVSEGGSAYRHRTVPNGCTEIQASLQHARIAVIGPHQRARIDHLDPGAAVIGVRLRPGAADLLGVSADEINDKRLPLEAIWGRAATELAEQIAEQQYLERACTQLALALGRRARDAAASDPLVPKIVETLQRVSTRRVDDLAGDLFLSPRQLRRRCFIAFGCGPKALQRVLRFQRYLSLSHFQTETSLASLAIQAGYADQAHLTHEAVDLAGVPPAKLLAETRSSCGPNHDHSVSFNTVPTPAM